MTYTIKTILLKLDDLDNENFIVYKNFYPKLVRICEQTTFKSLKNDKIPL